MTRLDTIRYQLAGRKRVTLPAADIRKLVDVADAAQVIAEYGDHPTHQAAYEAKTKLREALNALDR